MSCSEKPIFVLVKETPNGYSFDNDIKYSSPFANHILTQPADVTHPSLIVKSNWGIQKKNTITQMVTGDAGYSVLKNRKNTNFIKSYNKSPPSTVGLLYSNKNGYVLARTTTHLSGNAPSVAELSELLKDISNSPRDIKVRGSPLEYKRLLDYFQFLLVSKIQNDSSLFLTRPNNVHIMDDINDTTNNTTLEDAYLGMFQSDASNRTMYNYAYFVSNDRVAALASVIRGIPTIFQQTNPQNYYMIPPGTNSMKVKQVVNQFFMTSNRKDLLKQVVSDEWSLNTSIFHRNLNAAEKAKVLFYWIFNWPTTTSNIPIIESFFSILDTFHDFTGVRATNQFKTLLGENKNKGLFKSKTRNTINFNNVRNTSVAQKTLVRLLGVNIYRKVSSGYKNSLGNLVAGTNKRQKDKRGRKMTPNEKVGRFLYFITILLGSSPAIVDACEKLSRDILIKLGGVPIYERNKNKETFVFGVGGGNTSSNKLCIQLKNEGACLVVDAINGGISQCMQERSVYHNVGVLDPATRDILSWDQIKGNEHCIESPKVKKRDKQKKREANKRRRALKGTREKQKAMEERKRKAAATRAETIRRAAANAATARQQKERNRLAAAQRREKAAKMREEEAAKRLRNSNSNRAARNPSWNEIGIKRRRNITPNRVLNGIMTNSNSNSNSNNQRGIKRQRT